MSKKTVAGYCFALATMLVVQGALAANTNTSPKAAVSDYTRPLSLEPNRGQTDGQVDFLAHGTGYRLFLSHAKAVMALDRGVTVRMRPVGGKPSSSEPLEEQPSKSNYFIGNDPQKWHTGIANYAEVRYRNVYPGIDLIYYGNQRQLEYDFAVSPGADPNRILLQFQGGTRATLDPSGDLVMHTAAGDLRWHKPVAYQEINGNRKLIACSYARKHGGELAFAVGAYERTKPLVIDPELEYSTYLPTSSFGETSAGVAVDQHGNAYVVGSTNSADFQTTKGAFQMFYPGLPSSVSGNPSNSQVAFVTKFDTTGKLVYSTYLGGSGLCVGDFCGFLGGDTGTAIAVDNHGDAYVTGSTWSSDFPLTNFIPPTPGGTGGGGDYFSHTFITKLEPDGSALVYSTILGGGTGNCGFCETRGNAIAVDRTGSAYITGFTELTDFPIKDALQPTMGTAFVTKLDPAGNDLVYSTYLGGSGFDQGTGIAVDAEGQAYVTGSTSSPNFPTKDAFQNQLKTFRGNAFVTKFDASGNELVYSTYLGGSGSSFCCGFDQGAGIAVDVHGNAYVTGSTQSPDFPTTKDAFQSKLRSACTPGAPCGNAFVTKFGPSGALLHSTFLGGSGGDQGTSIAVDRQGDAYVTGVTHSTDFPTTKNAFQKELAGPPGGNAFVTKLDAAECALVYSTYLGGSGGAQGNGIALDARRSAYVTGGAGPDFPLINASQTTPVGAFVAKISAH